MEMGVCGFQKLFIVKLVKSANKGSAYALGRFLNPLRDFYVEWSRYSTHKYGFYGGYD
jgi:hypothetical protein